MFLPSGTRLGVYEILTAIGAGGMGEVYRARDTRLDRDIAIEILPQAFAADADRVARFEREARTLASLNHPNVAQIYGFEHAQGVHALVMELVSGEDLSQRIARGALPLDEALPIARQIAEALEVAHEQGIVHRDLKPANVKIPEDGTVKVLDFGLAQVQEPPPSAPGMSRSPTITTDSRGWHRAAFLVRCARHRRVRPCRGVRSTVPRARCQGHHLEPRWLAADVGTRRPRAVLSRRGVDDGSVHNA